MSRGNPKCDPKKPGAKWTRSIVVIPSCQHHQEDLVKNVLGVRIGHTKAPQRADQIVELVLVRLKAVVRHGRGGTCGFRGDLQVL